MPENCYLCDEPEPVDNHNTATLTAGLSTIISREIKSNRKSKQNADSALEKRDLALKEKSKRYFLIDYIYFPIVIKFFLTNGPYFQWNRIRPIVFWSQISIYLSVKKTATMALALRQAATFNITF